MLKGIDVSQHQGVIDWNKAKVDFAILRLGWIGNKGNHTLDTQFERNYTECKRLGIPVGVYVYNYCASVSTIKDGAEWAIEKLKGKALELPVYIDMEDNSISNQGKDKLTEMTFEFNQLIEKAGYWAGVYANKNWYDNYLHGENIKKRFTTWIAHYGVSEDKYAGEYDILQYTSKGKVNGISGNVDMNVMYRDLIAEIKGANKQQTKSIVDLANEVIAGKYGDGEERKKALGSLYDEVQAKVNEILKAKENTVTYYPKCNSKYASLVDALNSIKVDSSFENRKKMAQKNNMRDYTGTAQENAQLLTKLKAGRLRTV